MVITKLDDKFLKITTDLLPDALNGNFPSLKVDGNFNCCDTGYSETIDTTNRSLKLNLDEAVKLETYVQRIWVKNLVTGELINILPVFITLNYVSYFCEEPSGICTLETFSSHFEPLFRQPIDDYFASIGISSGVTVSFSGNTVIIDNMPVNFTLYSAEYGFSEPYTTILFTVGGSSKVFVNFDAIYVSSDLFDQSALLDGVYKLTIKFIGYDGSYELESNCAFVDVSVKCKVAATLQNILKEASVKGSEKTSTVIHMLHYALVNGSNCGCNCDELCQVYRELATMLNNIDPQITNDCGCS